MFLDEISRSSSRTNINIELAHMESCCVKKVFHLFVRLGKKTRTRHLQVAAKICIVSRFFSTHCMLLMCTRLMIARLYRHETIDQRFQGLL